MRHPLTRLLLLLVLTAALATAAAYARMAASASRAAAARRDLRACQADLADLAAWHVTARSAGDPPAAEDAALSRQVHRAAAAAGVGDRLASVEPGPSVRDGDALRTPVFVRLDGVSLAQTVTFLRALSGPAAGVRTTGIELTAPAGPAAAVASPVASPAGGPELWTADLTLSQTSARGP